MTPPLSVTMRDGQSLHVRVVGQGQPVLLLPGMGMTSSQWLPFIRPYRRHFRFYMPDFRGAGLSGKCYFNQLDIFQNNMEDVQDIVRHFGLKDFLLAGYSMGASTALHWLRAEGFADVRRYLHIDQAVCVPNRDDWPYGLFGERQPILFDGLRQLSTYLDEHSHHAGIAELPLAVRREVMGILSRTYLRLGAGRSMSTFFALCVHWPRLLSLMVPNPCMANAKAYLSSYLNAHDYRPCLRQCDTPITFMVGMKSLLYDARGQLEIARSVRRGRLVRFEKSGHMLVLREPWKFTRELGRFLHDRE
jgi:pimeloyl-ACP methyl ester carboxylesterase